MKLHILAVGRLRRGPEFDLVQDYVQRADKTGRGQSIGPVTVVEVDDRKGGGKVAEGALLLKAIPSSAFVIALDERGTVQSSPKFADQLSSLRDRGIPDVWCVIGGADGLDKDVLARADATLSFGAMVWPHMLVRVMVAEQIYRAVSILAGTPYHRE